MTKIVSGNSDTPLVYTNVIHRDLPVRRLEGLNEKMVSHDGEELPPKLNNAPIVDVSGGALAGGALAGGMMPKMKYYRQQVIHPSRLERLSASSRLKPKSNIERFLQRA